MILSVKTVGVMGDGRTYDYVGGAPRGDVHGRMTADFYPFDMGFIGTVDADHQRGGGVNRVVYEVTSKPPGTIEWE